RLLTVVRVMVLLVLLAIFLGPAAISTVRSSLPSLIVVLRDDSRSMGERDVYQDTKAAEQVARFQGTTVEKVREERPTRAALVDQALEKDNHKLLRELQERGKLRVVDFSTRIKRVDERPANLKPKSANSDKEKAKDVQ